jgi:hypothetical protein
MIHSHIPVLEVVFCLSALLTFGVTVAIVFPSATIVSLGARLSRQVQSTDEPEE